jgi:hypothetical protein
VGELRPWPRSRGPDDVEAHLKRLWGQADALRGLPDAAPERLFHFAFARGFSHWALWSIDGMSDAVKMERAFGPAFVSAYASRDMGMYGQLLTRWRAKGLPEDRQRVFEAMSALTARHRPWSQRRDLLLKALRKRLIGKDPTPGCLVNQCLYRGGMPADAHHAQARLHELGGRVAEGRLHAMAALVADPSHPAALAAAVRLTAATSLDEATALLDEARPFRAGDAGFDLAQATLDAARWSRGVGALPHVQVVAALRHVTEDLWPELLLLLAALVLEVLPADPQPAHFLSAFDVLTAQHPDAWVPWMALGWVRHHAGDLPGAAEALAQAEAQVHSQLRDRPLTHAALQPGDPAPALAAALSLLGQPPLPYWPPA